MECSIIVIRVTTLSTVLSGRCFWMHTNNIAYENE